VTKLAVAFFNNKLDNQPRQQHAPWDKLSDLLMRHKERGQKDGPLWSPTLYQPGTTRAKANVVSVSCLVLDFDNGDGPERFSRSWDGLTCVMHSTYQHSAEAQRWRVVFPLLQPVAATEWPDAWDRLVRRFGGNSVDASCKDASRIYYLPACPPDAERDAMMQEGDWLDPRDFIRPPVDLLVQRAKGELGNGRNTAGMWLACQLRDNGYTQTEAEQARWHTEVPAEKRDPAGRVDLYTEDEWLETVRKAFGRGKREAWKVPAVPKSNGVHPAIEPDEIQEVSAEPWDEIVDLALADLPPFPVRALPEWMADHVEAVGTATQTPADLAAMLGLSVLATAAQKRVEASPRQDWTEPLSLFTVTALASGNVKSGVYNHMVGPVSAYEMQVAEDMRAEVEGARLDREITEGRIKRLKDQAMKATNPFDRDRLREEAVELASALAGRRVVSTPRFLADDATPEKLAILLSEQEGRISVMSPEANAFEIMAGRYSSGQTNFTIYLKGHSGDDIRVDRVARPTLVIRRPAITMGLLAQPDVLVRLAEQQEFRERGLLARFLFCIPQSWVGRRIIEPDSIPGAIRETYDAALKRLLEIPADSDSRGEPCPHVLLFTEAAKSEITAFRTWLEPLLAEGAELGYLADWGGKLGGALVRIAALLHLGDLAEYEHPWEVRVDASVVARSVVICHYLLAHAKAAFRLIGSDPAILGARRVLRWLKRKHVEQLTMREIHNGMQGTFQKVEELEGPLKALVDHGYLRVVPVERKPGAGRAPSPIFEVNPAIFAPANCVDTVDAF